MCEPYKLAKSTQIALQHVMGSLLSDAYLTFAPGALLLLVTEHIALEIVGHGTDAAA